MFYGSAGGWSYTRLDHRYQKYLDLSDHLLTGRAILVGRGEERAAELLRDGQPFAQDRSRHWAFYRVVFPVQKSDRAERLVAPVTIDR